MYTFICTYIHKHTCIYERCLMLLCTRLLCVYMSLIRRSLWIDICPFLGSFRTRIFLLFTIALRGPGRSLGWCKYRCNFPARICANMKPNALFRWKQDWSKLYGLWETFSNCFSHHPPTSWPLPFRLDKTSLICQPICFKGLANRSEIDTFPFRGKISQAQYRYRALLIKYWALLIN